MELYKKEIAEIISKTSIKEGDIFNYEDSPHKDEFDETFNFYHDTLSIQEYYGIKPNLFFFNTALDLNAEACSINGYYIISITMAAVVDRIVKFKEKKDLLIDTDNNDFIEFEKFLDKPIHELMYQQTLHFTFYHEMGHLVQKSDYLNTKLNEQTNYTSKYTDEIHLLELDADKFSSLFMGQHIIDYGLKRFGEGITPDQLKKLLIIFCSSSLFHVLSFSGEKEIYFEEYEHPHPIIRITAVIMNIIHYCLESFRKMGINLELNPKDIINETLIFSDKLASKKFGTNYIENFRGQASKNAINIANYLAKFRALEKKDESLASHKWNLVALNYGKG